VPEVVRIISGVPGAYFGGIRTLIPEISGQRIGIIRTAGGVVRTGILTRGNQFLDFAARTLQRFYYTNLLYRKALSFNQVIF